MKRIDRTDPALEALELEVLPKDAPYSKLNPRGIWWGEYSPSGELVAATCLSIWIPGWAFLARTIIKSNFRGKGLQKRFIRVREKYARAHGVHTIVTYTSPDNIISANNLIKCGYLLYIPQEKWGIQPFCYYFKKNIKKD
jgi:RimJ/RimL family protein N-acetyltransferase